MKEKVTKFDFEAAFKALDEIEIPKVSGVRANRMNLSESVKRVDRFETLFEDYYDVRDPQELDAAKDVRDADIAKAKLAKIEKIVDLDAESEEDIQPSYVGKTIIQCPQCMTLFYKDPADIVVDEENPEVVNVAEVCQHCGNDSGYSVIGKVAEEKPEAPAEEVAVEETAVEEVPAEEPVAEENNSEEQLAEETTEDTASEDDLDLDIDIDEESEEDDKKEESLNRSEFLKNAEDNEMNTKHHSENLTLNEQVEDALNESTDKDLDAKLKEHNDYIEYLQNQISDKENAVKNAKNEFVKNSIQSELDNLKAELDAALPDAVKAEVEVNNDLPAADEVPAEDTADEKKEEVAESLTEAINITPEHNDPAGEPGEPGVDENGNCPHCHKNPCECKEIKESVEADLAKFAAGLEECVNEDLESELKLKEYADSLPEAVEPAADDKDDESKDTIKLGDLINNDPNVSNAEFSAMLKNPLYYEGFDKALAEAKESIDECNQLAEEESFEDAEEIIDENINSNISTYLKEVYSNVKNFEMTGCEMNKNKLMIEGKINFNSGKSKSTKFEFINDGNILYGSNKQLTEDKAFKVNYTVKNKQLFVENFNYKYKINESLVEGCTRK